MKEYNSAFFGLFENVFKHLKEKFGEEQALASFREIMEMGLEKSYGKDFVHGNTAEFKRMTEARDNLVGLRVMYPVVSDDQIIYEFYDDPFPGLKGLVDSHKLDDTYIRFKVKYLLGDNWDYKTTQHLWRGDDCTRHIISRV